MAWPGAPKWPGWKARSLGDAKEVRFKGGSAERIEDYPDSKDIDLGRREFTPAKPIGHSWLG